MRSFVVKEGTEAIAVKWNGLQNPTMEKVVIKKETMYFIEDIAIDPVGKVACGPQYNTIGGMYAKKGYYGFNLPKNKSGWDCMLVHSNDVEVG